MPDPEDAARRRRAAPRGRVRPAGAHPVRLPLPVERVPRPQHHDGDQDARGDPQGGDAADQDAGRIDPSLVADSDGFSPGQTILTHLPGATITGLPTQDTIALSVTTKSPTILLNAETGELVPHFAELDEEFATDDDSARAFMIRPVVRLADATRYIVAIRHVVDANGHRARPDAGVPGPARRDPLVRSLGRAAAEPLRGHLREARDGRHPEERPAARLGLLDREPARTTRRGSSPCATTRSPRWARRGPRTPSSPRRRPARRPTPRRPPRATTSRSAANPAETHALSPSEIGSGNCSAGRAQPARLAAALRPDDRADLHDHPEPGRRAELRHRRAAGAERHGPVRVRGEHPHVGDDEARPPAPERPRPARRQDRGRRQLPRRDRRPGRLRVRRRRPGRHVPGRLQHRRQLARGRSRPVQGRSSGGSTRASSTSCSRCA